MYPARIELFLREGQHPVPQYSTCILGSMPLLPSSSYKDYLVSSETSRTFSSLQRLCSHVLILTVCKTPFQGGGGPLFYLSLVKTPVTL